MKNVIVMPFSSFLAGALIARKDLSDFELCTMWTDFQYKYNVQFTDEQNDIKYHALKNFFQEGSGFRLNGDYTDVVSYEGKKFMVYDCLYAFTNEYVRDYFGFPRSYSPDYKWEMDSREKKRS